MHGGHFYHKSLRKYTLLLGNLFSNIYVSRGDGYRKVPVTITSKEHFVAALNTKNAAEGGIAGVATMLPRIGIQMVAMTYDATRKTNIANRATSRKTNDDRPALNKLFNAVPYDVEFEVSIYTRHQDDAYQIIEQIVPYFQPQFNTMIKELDENEVVIDERDIPIILETVTPEETLEGAAGEMRRIEWTLNMRLKGWLYPPTNAQYGEIRTIYLNFNDEETEVIHAEREGVALARDISWDVRDYVNRYISVDWRANILANPTGMSWNVRERIPTLVDVPWTVLNRVNQSTELSWDFAIQVRNDASLYYDVRNSTSSDLSIEYNTYDGVAANVIGVNWNVLGSVLQSTTSISYNVQTSVLKNIGVSYNTQSKTNISTQMVGWDYARYVSKTATTKWWATDTITTVTSYHPLVWGLVYGKLDSSWVLEKSVRTDLDVSYQVRMDISDSVDVSYEVENISIHLPLPNETVIVTPTIDLIVDAVGYDEIRWYVNDELITDAVELSLSFDSTIAKPGDVYKVEFLKEGLLPVSSSTTLITK